MASKKAKSEEYMKALLDGKKIVNRSIDLSSDSEAPDSPYEQLDQQVDFADKSIMNNSEKVEAERFTFLPQKGKDDYDVDEEDKEGEYSCATTCVPTSVTQRVSYTVPSTDMGSRIPGRVIRPNRFPSIRDSTEIMNPDLTKYQSVPFDSSLERRASLRPRTHSLSRSVPKRSFSRRASKLVDRYQRQRSIRINELRATENGLYHSRDSVNKMQESLSNAMNVSKPPERKRSTSGNRKNSKCLELTKRFYRRFGIRHVLLLAVLTAYASIGALIFHLIESPNEQATLIARREESTKRIHMYVEKILNVSTIYCDNDTHCQIDLINILSQYNIDTGYQTTLEIPLYNWDYWNSWFYAGTVFTTIGYGNMACKTRMGRLATIIYATFGIPIMLTVLNDLGKLIFVWARKFWNAVRRCLRYRIVDPIRLRIQKKNPEDLRRGVSRMTSHSEEIGFGDIDKNFPLPLAMLIVFAYIFCCARMFMIWETNWDYFTAFYFFFISLSTIGFGDEMPEHPHFTTLSFVFFIVGLALVSMCINVMQAKVEAKYVEALGMIEESYLADLEEELTELEEAGLPLPASVRSSLIRRGERGDTLERPTTLEGLDQSPSAALGVLQIYRRSSRGSRSSVHFSESENSPMTPCRLQAIAEVKDEGRRSVDEEKNDTHL